MGLMMVLMGTVALGQKEEVSAVKKVIESYAQNGDAQNPEALNSLLDENFRVIMNRMFGSSEVSVMPKSVYLDKIRAKEFGGDQRKVSIEEVIINGETASAKVTFEGSKMSFVSLFQFVKNADGNWLIINELPRLI